MAKTIQWNKAQARKELETIAADMAKCFGITAPAVAQPEHRTGRDWSFAFDTVEVWTKAGRAELHVDISARFTHLYFRFDDPARAAQVFAMSHHDQRLNRHSGKWNHLATPDSWARDGKPCPQTSLEFFRAELLRDFHKVAEPNPPAAEVAAYRAKQAERAAQWEKAMAELIPAS